MITKVKLKGILKCITPLIAVTAVSWCGCKTTAPSQTGGDDSETQTVRQLSQAVPKAEMLDESALEVDKIIPERVKEEEDRMLLSETSEPPATTAPESEYPVSLVKGIKNPDEKVNVLLNLDAAPLNEVVPLFAELLDFNYLIDPSVKGAVTMTVESQMSAREVWKTFEHVLWLAGAYASKNPGFIHILPFQKMARERRMLTEHDPQANVEVAVLPVKYSKSAKMVALLKPFITPGATLTNLPRRNCILAVEAPPNLSKLRKLVDMLDKKGEAAWPRMAVRWRTAVYRKLPALLPPVFRRYPVKLVEHFYIIAEELIVSPGNVEPAFL
ncbi:MAG: hypothetical protein R6V56_03740, partial [Lentisphaeria bacterium]